MPNLYVHNSNALEGTPVINTGVLLDFFGNEYNNRKVDIGPASLYKSNKAGRVLFN